MELEGGHLKKLDISLVRNHLIVHANIKSKHGYSTWSFGFSSDHGPQLNQSMVGNTIIDEKGHNKIVMNQPPTTADNGLVSNSQQFYDHLRNFFR